MTPAAELLRESFLPRRFPENNNIKEVRRAAGGIACRRELCPLRPHAATLFSMALSSRNAPRDSWVYALFNRSDLLYVGEAASIFTRLLDHFDQRDFAEFETPTTVRL